MKAWLVGLVCLSLSGAAWADMPWDPDWSRIPEERRLVVLRPGPLGYEAEASPDFDYSLYLPRRYRVEGLEAQVLRGVALREGFPIRLRGRYTGDRVKVEANRPSVSPPLLPLPPTSEYWRGCVESVGVSLEPPRARLEVGDGRTWVADLDFESAQQRRLWQSQWQRCWLRTTCWRSGDKITASDIVVAPAPDSPPSAAPVRFVAQASELFLERVSQRYLKLNSHLLVFQDPLGASRLAVDRMGISLQNCPPGAVRIYGRASGQANLPSLPDLSFPGGAVQVVEGEWEALADLRFEGSQLHLRCRPESVELRLTRPLFLQVPPAWTASLAELLSQVVTPTLVLPLPGAYGQELVDSGIMDRSELSRWALSTRPTGDRRSSFLAVMGPVHPSAGGSPMDPLQSRLRRQDEFVLRLSPEAVNRGMKAQLGRLLPLQQGIPAEMRRGPSVLFLTLELLKLEVTQLELSYARLGDEGLFSIDNCVTAVHWRLGPLSGVEPGAQAKGYARVHGEGNPLTLSATTDLQYLEFLSPHIRQQSAQEQQRLREQLVGGLKQMKLQLPLSPRVPLPLLGPSAQLLLTGLECRPDELVLHGQVGE